MCKSRNARLDVLQGQFQQPSLAEGAELSRAEQLCGSQAQVLQPARGSQCQGPGHCPGSVVLLFTAQQPGRDLLLLTAHLLCSCQPRKCSCASHSSSAALGLLLPFYPGAQFVWLVHCIARFSPTFQFHCSTSLVLKRKWQDSFRRRN